jgi:uncharacterized protein
VSYACIQISISKGARVNKPFGQVFWSVVAAGITLILLALIGINGLERVRAKTFTISATGSAVKSIRSDLAVWTFEIAYSGYDDYKNLYTKIKPVPQQIQAFLQTQGIDPKQLQLGPVNITNNLEQKTIDCPAGDNDCLSVVVEKIKLRQKIISRTKYTVSRYFTLESTSVDKVMRASNSYDALFEKGILIGNSSLKLLYTKLAELRLELVKLASEDAYARADLIAKPTGRRITMIEDGRLGVFQINAKNDPSVEDLGNFDTTSLEKDVRAIVTGTYRVE